MKVIINSIVQKIIWVFAFENEYLTSEGIIYHFWWERSNCHYKMRDTILSLRSQLNEIILNSLTDSISYASIERIVEQVGTLIMDYYDKSSCSKCNICRATKVDSFNKFSSAHQERRFTVVLSKILTDKLDFMIKRRQQMVSQTAYSRYQTRKRLCLPDDSLTDWVSAEAEVDIKLGSELNLHSQPKMDKTLQSEIKYQPGTGLAYKEAKENYTLLNGV